jgi:hypothetical protein
MVFVDTIFQQPQELLNNWTGMRLLCENGPSANENKFTFLSLSLPPFKTVFLHSRDGRQMSRLILCGLGYLNSVFFFFLKKKINIPKKK